jgi:hypothetical protein
LVENGRTGERVDFVVESDELLRMEVTWSKPGVRTLRFGKSASIPMRMLLLPLCSQTD